MSILNKIKEFFGIKPKIEALSYPGRGYSDQTVIFDQRDAIILEDSVPADTTDKLYNDAGVLTFDGNAVGNITSGTAGNLALYPATGIVIDDIYVQNANNINIAIAAHAALAAPRTYTIPEVGSSSSFILSAGALVYTPSTTQAIVGATGLTAAMIANKITRIQGSGGAVTVSATPSIVAGQDGQVLILQGDSDANTVTLNDEASTAGSTLELAGGVAAVLGKGDILVLTYDLGDSKWYEISRSNN